MLQYYPPGLEAAGHEGQVAHRRCHPLLTYMVTYSALSHLNIIQEGVMVERKHYIKGAIRANLNAPLANLVNDIKIMPVQQGRHLSHLIPVKLTLARDGCVAGGTHYGHATLGVSAVPDYAPSPGLECLLAQYPSGDGSWASAHPDGEGSLVS